RRSERIEAADRCAAEWLVPHGGQRLAAAGQPAAGAGQRERLRRITVPAVIAQSCIDEEGAAVIERMRRLERVFQHLDPAARHAADDAFDHQPELVLSGSWYHSER